MNKNYFYLIILEDPEFDYETSSFSTTKIIRSETFDGLVKKMDGCRKDNLPFVVIKGEFIPVLLKSKTTNEIEARNLGVFQTEEPLPRGHQQNIVSGDTDTHNTVILEDGNDITNDLYDQEESEV